MIRIGKIYEFESAHYLPNHKGKCKNLHGHQWKVEVVVKGFITTVETSPEWGMLIDFGELDNIVDPIIDEFDHKVLNDLLPNPTAENITLKLVDKIKDFLPASVTLIKLRVWEKPGKSYAEWRSE